MPSKNPCRVLCVDDDLDACQMLTLLLSFQEIEVTCAQSAAEAWPKIKAESFDLYLLDSWLPKLNGFDFCRQIRESDSLTPIIFYSGAGYDADKQMGLAAGANAYVTKPDVEGLIDATLELVAQARAGKAAAPSPSNSRRLVEHRGSTQLVFSVASAGN